MTTRNRIFDLPAHLLFTVLDEWLDGAAAIAKLDSAVTNHTDRHHYMAAIEGRTFNNFMVEMNEKSQPWMDKRKVHFATWKLYLPCENTVHPDLARKVNSLTIHYGSFSKFDCQPYPLYPNVRSFHMVENFFSHPDLTKEITKLNVFESLETLKIEYVDRMNDQTFFQLSQNCSKTIRNVVINNCPGLTARGIVHALQHLPNLESVTWSANNTVNLRSGNFPEFFEESKGWPNVEELTLSGCGFSGNIVCTLLQQPVKLRKLRVQVMHNDVKEEEVVRIIEKHGQTLEDILFRGCSKISDATIKAVTQYCNSDVLKALRLSAWPVNASWWDRYRRISDSDGDNSNLPPEDRWEDTNSFEVMNSMISKFSGSLQTLQLDGMLGITDAMVRSILINMKNLESLSVKYAPLLTDKALEELVESGEGVQEFPIKMLMLTQSPKISRQILDKIREKLHLYASV